MTQTSVSIGFSNSDKIADQIADAILDELLMKHRDAVLSCEVNLFENVVVVVGQIDSRANIDIDSVVKSVLASVNYAFTDLEIITDLSPQSLDIHKAVFKSLDEIGAGDQAIVVGYACNESFSYMPLSKCISDDVIKRLSSWLENKGLLRFCDLKCFVSLQKCDGEFKLENLFVSVPEALLEEYWGFKKSFFEEIVSDDFLDNYEIVYSRENIFLSVYKNSRFEPGSLNTRIISDSYGMSVKCGGGGYSGKDLTKIDRLGAYYARWICKNLVAAKVCDSVELSIVYSLGCESPIMFFAEVSGGKFSEEEILISIEKIFPLKISEVMRIFNSVSFKFRDLSRYGHFGRNDICVPWENLDKVSDLKSYFGL